MRILVVTCEWPDRSRPWAGIFVKHQAKALQEHGLDVEVLAFRGAKNPLQYISAISRMRKLLRERPVDVIHAHFGQSGLVAITQWQIPVVVTFYGSDLYGLAGDGWLVWIQSQLLQLISRVVARRADEVIAISEGLASLLPQRGYHLIPMGVDLATFTPIPKNDARKLIGWSSEEKAVLFVSDPANPIKRFGLASEAVRLVSQCLPSVILRVAWGVTPEQVPIYMSAADVLIVTSLHEGGPRVVRESLACNLPVVSVDVGDVRERISSVDGCVVCVNDQAETIADGLMQVLTREHQIDGRLAVLDLDEKCLAERVLSVYEMALEKNARKS